MPPLATKFRASVSLAIQIASICERPRTNSFIGRQVRTELTVSRTSLIYELAYLRTFNLWEIFLEDTFIRYLCGYRFRGLAETPITSFATSMASARTVIYAGRSFLLWHNPTTVVRLANQHFNHGNRPALVIGSMLADIEAYASIRHRIAHDHLDAKVKFDQACMRLTSRRFPGSRPGIMLRDRSTYGGTNLTWLERISLELCAVATQLAP